MRLIEVGEMWISSKGKGNLELDGTWMLNDGDMFGYVRVLSCRAAGLDTARSQFEKGLLMENDPNLITGESGDDPPQATLRPCHLSVDRTRCAWAMT